MWDARLVHASVCGLERELEERESDAALALALDGGGWDSVSALALDPVWVLAKAEVSEGGLVAAWVGSWEPAWASGWVSP